MSGERVLVTGGSGFIGAHFVLHVASPFPSGAPKHEDEPIVPAREGAPRVLRAARDAGVKRVVLTSSFAAVGYGKKPTDRPFSEESWTRRLLGRAPQSNENAVSATAESLVKLGLLRSSRKAV